jgi:hypothetical protein
MTQQVVNRRKEEPLTEALQRSTDHHPFRTQRLGHDREQQAEKRTNRHGTDEEPLGSESLGQLAGAHLRNDVAPEERRQHDALVVPIVDLQSIVVPLNCRNWCTYRNVGVIGGACGHRDDANRQVDPDSVSDEGQEEI